MAWFEWAEELRDGNLTADYSDQRRWKRHQLRSFALSAVMKFLVRLGLKVLQHAVDLPTLIEFSLRESFPDRFFDARLLFGAEQAPVDPALHRVEQLHPILQRRVLDCLPLIKAFFAREKQPFATDMLNIHLHRDAVVRNPFPADFRLCHERVTPDPHWPQPWRRFLLHVQGTPNARWWWP